MHELLAPPLENARVLALATSMAYLQNSVPPNLALARSLSKQMRTLPPGGWHRSEGVDDPLSVLRHPLRYREPPVTALHPKPHPTTWATKVGGAAGLISRHASPKTLPAWRHGRPPPAWWVRQQAAARAPKALKQSSPEVARLKERVKQAMAKNLNRVVDTFREWDADLSGRVDKREFFLACKTGLGIEAPKRAFDALFDEVDTDGSGSIDYKELNKVLRRRVWDPSFKDQWGDDDDPRTYAVYDDGDDDFSPQREGRRAMAHHMGAPHAQRRPPTPPPPPWAAFDEVQPTHWTVAGGHRRPITAPAGYEATGTTLVMPSGVPLTAEQYEQIIRTAQASRARGEPVAPESPRTPGRWMAATMNGSYRDVSSRPGLR